MKPDQERVKNLLTDTVTLLCKNGLFFEDELRVEGLLGITLDDNDVFLVHINEKFKNQDSDPCKEDSTMDKEDALSLLTGQHKSTLVSIDKQTTESAVSTREITLRHYKNPVRRQSQLSQNSDDKGSGRKSLGGSPSSLSPSSSLSSSHNGPISTVSTIPAISESNSTTQQTQPQDLSIKEEPTEAMAMVQTRKETSPISCQLAAAASTAVPDQDEIHLMQLGYSSLLETMRKRQVPKAHEANEPKTKRQSLDYNSNNSAVDVEDDSSNGFAGGAFVAGVAPNMTSPVGQWPMIDPTLFGLASAKGTDGQLSLPNPALWAAQANAGNLPQSFTPTQMSQTDMMPSNSRALYEALMLRTRRPSIVANPAEKPHACPFEDRGCQHRFYHRNNIPRHKKTCTFNPNRYQPP